MSSGGMEDYLRPTPIIDSDDADIVAKAEELCRGLTDDKEKVGRIYYFVRDLPYEIEGSFRYVAEGKTRASDVLRAGKAFCMGKASLFVALCRAAGVPARVAFQELSCPDKVFLGEVGKMWGERNLPWHTLGEAYVGGKWLKLDATIDKPQAEREGRRYKEYDGESDIPTVEGPILRELGGYADYPSEIARWYEGLAREVVKALDEGGGEALGDAMFEGPGKEEVLKKRSG
ncbi:MAG: transglutaminase family protein [Nitrospinota bacterium]